jgi:ferritin-like metal-binding protein YciE
MSIQNLKDLYIDQLQDIYSANRQSLEATRQLREMASADDLRSALDAGVNGIEEGIAKVEVLIKGHNADPTGEFCKGMEGLVKEAKAHAINADIADADTRDASIITQYQRMTHYALAGYGTAAAFAKRLNLEQDAAILDKCLDDTYGGDRTMTAIATGEVNKEAA